MNFITCRCSSLGFYWNKMILEISCSHSSILRYLGIQQVVFGGRRMGDWEEGMTSTEDGYKSFKVWDRFNALTFLVSQLVHMRACWGSSQIKKESQLCRWDVICQVCSIEWSSLRIGCLCKVKLFFFYAEWTKTYYAVGFVVQIMHQKWR